MKAKKSSLMPCPIPTGSSPSDRVIYISKDAYLNVEYDVNCFQSKFVTEKKIKAKFFFSDVIKMTSSMRYLVCSFYLVDKEIPVGIGPFRFFNFLDMR